MLPKLCLLLAAMLGATGVTLGAYQAHGLDGYLKKLGSSDETVAKRLDQCDVAVRYQMYHALALLGIGVWGLRLGPGGWTGPLLVAASAFFLGGIALFSGGLYLIVFSGDTDIAMIVPFGGLAFILGWLGLAGAAATTVSSGTAMTPPGVDHVGGKAGI